MGLFSRKDANRTTDAFTAAKKAAEKAKKDVIFINRQTVGLIAGGESDKGGSLEEGRAVWFCVELIDSVPGTDNKALIKYVKEYYGFGLERCIAVVAAYNMIGNPDLWSRLEALLDEAMIDNANPELTKKLQILVSDALFKKEDRALAEKFELVISNVYKDIFTDIGKKNAKQALLSEYEKVLKG